MCVVIWYDKRTMKTGKTTVNGKEGHRFFLIIYTYKALIKITFKNPGENGRFRVKIGQKCTKSPTLLIKWQKMSEKMVKINSVYEKLKTLYM